MPAWRARWEASWMTGPSAVGSENGTPSSRMSRPAPQAARRISKLVSGFGIAGGQVADEGFLVGGGKGLEGGGDAVHGVGGVRVQRSGFRFETPMALCHG
jgi:hypothetical protein